MRKARDLLGEVAGRGVPSPSPSERVSVTSYRDEGNEAAIVFVHGFSSSGFAFGRFPELLAANPALNGWDIYGLGYSTGLSPDLAGGWETDPSIELLGTYLSSRARLSPLDRYGGVALIAHSMGGLVSQQALVSDPVFADRVSHLFCFGTPSGGLRSASWSGFLKRQVADMALGGPFITTLRRRWEELWRSRPFDLWVTAGDRDAFVPPSSSLDPFPEENRLVVPGNHSGIVAVRGPGTMSEQVVVKGLIGDAAPAGPWNSARVAVERGRFDEAIRKLMPIASELDEAHLVDLALALEGMGRGDEALELLRSEAGRHGTDAKGVLAGRLKRAWQLEGRRDDAESALALYTEGMEAAIKGNDHRQAYYHAINVAFLRLAYQRDPESAAATARTALGHCADAPSSHWRDATEAEAHIHTGEEEKAIAGYQAAVGQDPDPHELESAWVQGIRTAEELGRTSLAERIDQVFRPEAGVG